MALKHGHYRGCTTPGPITIVWKSMQQRCNDPNSPNYQYYGAKGIKIEWASFEEFEKDMHDSWRPGLQIDRWPDRNGNYKPGNCRWATPKQQTRNRSSNRWIEFNGRKMVMEDWANELGLKQSTLSSRLTRGWSVEDALSTPIKPRRKLAI